MMELETHTSVTVILQEQFDDMCQLERLSSISLFGQEKIIVESR